MSDVLVLYQISNEAAGNPAGGETSYNAFRLPRKGGVTLATVKRNCLALRNLNARGPNGYHWRVRIDEKPNTSHSSGAPSAPASKNGAIPFSWWDVQDENARLPVKEATPSELKRMFAPQKKTSSEMDPTVEVSKAAKGAIRSLGKAMSAVAGAGSGGATHHMEEDDFDAPRTSVIAFKLMDIGKANRGAAMRRGGGGATSANVGGGARRARPRPAPAAPRQQQPPQPRVAAPVSGNAPRIPAHMLRAPPGGGAPPSNVAKPAPTRSAPPVAPTANLMDFGAAPTAATAHPSTLHHASSMPVRTSGGAAAAPSKETRTEKLKREYAKKNATANRVWDDIDQRWVEAKAPSAGGASSSASANGSSQSGAAGASKVKGISLDASNAIGKSANVQAAVNSRVNDMKESQEKAVDEMRQREAAKKQADDEEDEVRKRLESKIKEWSEEHGQKKMLSALLANLHTILWEGSNWKQISLADVLDNSKVKKSYHKASRVVHPDKTHHLDAEKRFIAKRVFDALTQAKTEFDNNAK